MKAQRNSRLELLRIISMLLIVAWHYSTQFKILDGVPVLDSGMSVFHVFAIVFGSWGQLGVDLFIIISVFYLSKSNKYRTRKVVDLVLETVFYGAFWAIVCILFLQMQLSAIDIIKSVFSLFFGTYWFATAYVLMYFFSPMINELLKKCSERFLKKLSLLLLVFVCLYKTLYKSAPVCDFLFFVCIYVLVFTIENTNLKDIFEKKAKKGLIICTACIIAINTILVAIGDYLESSFILQHSYYINLRGSIFILADALFIFYAIKKIPANVSAAINLIAGTCFGIFLSHQGLGFHVWNAILARDLGNSWQAIIYMVFAVLVIFICCSLIDLL